MTSKAFSLKSLVGDGYRDFWNFRGRYRVVKGSKGSKKSKTAALWFIINLMQYPQANLLVVRKVERNLRNSVFADLQWAIYRIDQALKDLDPNQGIAYLWRCTVSPLEITYLPTGQKVLFRGFDDPMKLGSTTVSKGVLCWVWVEEAFEVNKLEDFEKLDLSIRGEMPPNSGLFKQITLTFNPWSETHWLKKRFFDKSDPQVLALTTTYKINEWLDDADRRMYEDLRINRPRTYRVAGLGEWGISEGVIYENVTLENFDFLRLIKKGCKAFYGLDFGYTDPTAFVGGCIDDKTKTIYIALEWYCTAVTNVQIFKAIKELGIKREAIYCDSAEPKSIEELKKLGLNALPAAKGADSVRFGIQKIQGYRIVINPDCAQFYHEILNYTWAKDRNGIFLDRPDHEFSHGMDAMRYGINELIEGNLFTWKRIF